VVTAFPMKALRQLGLLKLNVRSDAGDPEDHRVLALFRNRAELKKAYAALQDEIYRLKDRIKQQEGATLRTQEMLGVLETRLGLAESGFSALVFYQLRRLWQSGRELIEQFVAELARQLEERERRAHLAEHNRRQFARRQDVEARLNAAQSSVAAAHERLAQLNAAHARLTKFWHYLKRRALVRQCDAARAATAVADLAMDAARDVATALEQEPQPEFPGLSVEARRTINMTAIAHAEVLCMRLRATPLVARAREATARREITESYGTRAECEALMAEIERASLLMQARTNIAQEVKERGGRLRKVARFRHASETVPTTESIALAESDAPATAAASGATAAKLPNVLAEDTWDLFRVLLR
jgi:hypothetical protein